MPLVGIRLEISEVDAIGVRRYVRRHHLAVKRRVNPKPQLAVVTGDDAIAVPAFGVGALTRVQKPQLHRHTRRALQPKVKPLSKFGRAVDALVSADIELDILRIGEADDVNRT